MENVVLETNLGSLKLFKKRKVRGIYKFWDNLFIITDANFEFGFCNGEVILIDNSLAPDLFGFWSKGVYKRLAGAN